MARMRGPRFKQCRRLGLNVSDHTKAMKRFDPKNPKQARDSKRLSEYGLQLLEKQRLRGYYEVLEKQFKRYVLKAMKSEETTGNALITALETRLDNIVYRLHFARTIRQARQMVVHGHILVNGRKVDIPSYAVKPGDKIVLREKSRKNQDFKDNFVENTVVVPYLSKDINEFSGELVRLPDREEVPIEIQDIYVVEFYSRLQ